MEWENRIRSAFKRGRGEREKEEARERKASEGKKRGTKGKEGAKKWRGTR